MCVYHRSNSPRALGNRSTSKSTSTSTDNSTTVCPSTTPNAFTLPIVSISYAHGMLNLILMGSNSCTRKNNFNSPSPRALTFLGTLPRHVKTGSVIFRRVPLPRCCRILEPITTGTTFTVRNCHRRTSACCMLSRSYARTNKCLKRNVSYPSRSSRFRTLHRKCVNITTNRSRHGKFMNRCRKLLLVTAPAYNFGACNPTPTGHTAQLVRFSVHRPCSPHARLLRFNRLINGPDSGHTCACTIGRTTPNRNRNSSLLHGPSL